MIVDERIRSLIERIETTDDPDPYIRDLVIHVRANCERPDTQELYRSYHTALGVIEPYPIDNDGYAQSFDPLTDEAALVQAWFRYGVVVGKALIAPNLCERAITRIHELIRELSNGSCNLSDEATYDALPKDSSGVSIISRGFFEVYHDAVLARIRQAVRLYLYHVLLWERADLWTSFDRLGMKLPRHIESEGLPLHVDQNPNVHAGFRTTQGVLALRDCPLERGTTVVVSGSKRLFSAYGSMARNRGEYVELDPTDPAAIELTRSAQPLPLRQGDVLSWDSRTTHANTSNVSDETRYIALISAGPAREDSEAMQAARAKAFLSGEGKNVREALMHASKKPRYTDLAPIARVRKKEQLTLLGELLYGQTSYDSL